MKHGGPAGRESAGPKDTAHTSAVRVDGFGVALWGLAVGIAYFGAAFLGLRLVAEPEGVAVFWPAAGIAVGALTIAPDRGRAAVLSAILLATLAVNLLNDARLGVAVIFAVVNTSQALLVARLLAWRFKGPIALDSLGRVLGLLAAAAVGAAVAAGAGGLAFRLLGASPAPFLDVARIWFVADLVGMVSVAPLLFAGAAIAGTRSRPREWVEGAALLLALFGAAAFLLGRPQTEGPWELIAPLAILFPLLLWIAARCPAAVAAAAAFLIAVATVWYTAAGHGPFAVPALPLGERVLAAQAFVLSTSICALLLSALMSARRRAEMAVRESERRLRRVLDNLFTFVSVLTPDGLLLWVNRAPLQAAGLSIDEVRGRPFEAAWWWSHDPAVQARLRTAIDAAARGEVSRYDADVRMGGGRIGTVDFMIAPLYDESGRITHLIPSAVDITQRKMVEAALRESEARLLMAQEAGGIGVWDWDVVADRAICSDSYFRLLGLTPSAGVSKAEFLNTLHPDDRERVANALRRALDGHDYDEEYRTVLPSDGIRWIAGKGKLIANAAGAPARMIGVVYDVTARRAAEAALARSEEQARAQLAELDAIYATAPIGLCIIDRDSRYVRINDRLAEINGLPAEQHIGRRLRDVIPDIGEQAEALLSRVLAGEMIADVEVAGQTEAAPGIRRYWNESWFPLRDAAGRVIGANVVVEEITERKQAEENQKLLLRELDHRVKNMLAVVQSLAAQTARTAPSPGDFSQAFADRLKALSAAHDLLKQRGWQGAWLADLARRTMAPHVTEEVGGRRRISIKGPRVCVSASSAVNLGMAFHELATNAVKYGALSTPTGRVSVTWRLDGSVNREPSFVEIAWRERGGPAVQPPSRRGFGSELIERGLAWELQAEVSLDFDPAGVCCRIRLPISEKVRAD